jgi:hypothetical protein
MCSVVGIVVGIISGGLSFYQHQQNIAAQNAAIDTANQNARAQFAVAELQTKIRNTEEEQKKQMQDLNISTTDFLADRGLEQDFAQINVRWMEEEEAKAWKKQTSGIEALETQGSIIAAGREGNSIINLINDVVNKQNKFDYNQDRGFAFVGRGLQMDKKRSLIASASSKASLQPYQKRTWIDPARPIDRPRIRSNTLLAGLSAGLKGFSSGTSAAAGWEKYQYYKNLG